MARPPIIISNGGVITALAHGCENLSQSQVEAKLKENVVNITKVDVETGNCDSEVVLIKKPRGETTFCLYWRLKNSKDTSYNDSLNRYGINDPHAKGEERITINQIMDNDV
jgi:hypothetical protein